MVSRNSKPSYMKNESDDEDLSDDNDLMANFNATSSNKTNKYVKDSGYPKPMARKSREDDGFSGGENPLMMTMKKPMQTTKRPVSPPSRTGNKLSSLGERDSESEYSDDELRSATSKPSFLRGQRPKSPSVQGRRAGAALQEDVKPKPQPRQATKTQPTKSPVSDRISPLSARQSSYDFVDSVVNAGNSIVKLHQPDHRKTPTDHRKSPVDLFSVDKRINDENSLDSKRKSPFADRKSPYDAEFNGERRKSGVENFSSAKKTPNDSRKSPFEDRKYDSRQSPFEDRKSPHTQSRSPAGSLHGLQYDDLDAPLTSDFRRTPTERKKSLADERKSPMEMRKSPIDDVKGRRKADDHALRDQRKSPHGTGSRSPYDDTAFERRGQNYADRKSPAVDRQQKSPYDPAFNRDMRGKSPHADNGKTPTSKRQSSSPHKRDDSGSPERRKGSVLDYLTGAAATRTEAFSDDDDYNGSRRRVTPNQRRQKAESPSPRRQSTKEPANPFDRVMKSPGPVSKEKPKAVPKSSKQQPPKQTKKEEGRTEELSSEDESSVCEELIEEPVKETKPKSEAGSSATENRPKSQRTERQKAEETIEKVKDAQSGTKMRFIEPAEGDPASKQQRPDSASKSATQKILKPQPRYARPSSKTALAATSEKPPISFDSTDAIRQAVFDQWKAQRLERAKQDALEKQRKIKEEEEKKKKEKESKEEEGDKAYKSWCAEKKYFVPESKLKKKEEEKKAAEEERKKREKKEEAERTFLKWKESVDEELKEKKKEKLKKEKKVEDEKKHEKEMKLKDAKKAFRSWKQEKDELIQTRVREASKEEEMKKRQEMEEQSERQREARRRYEDWLEQKERAEIMNSIRARALSSEQEKRRSWRPPSNTVHAH